MASRTCIAFTVLFLSLLAGPNGQAEDPCTAECNAKFEGKDPMLMGGCLSACYKKLAIKTGSADQCDPLKEKAGAFYNQCLGDYINKTKDIRACSKLRAGKMVDVRIVKWSCIGTAVRDSKDLTPCRGLTDPGDKDACVFGIAKGQKKAEFCSSITGAGGLDPNLKNRCFEEVGRSLKR